MRNLKEDLKNIARARRSLFNDLYFIKSGEDNLKRLGRFTKREEAKIYKSISKINQAIDDLDAQLDSLDYQGLTSEEKGALSLEILEELDKE